MEHNANTVKVGYNAAHDMETADLKASKSKRTIVMGLAIKYSEDDQAIKAILEGVGQYHTEQGHSDGFTRRIKSEIKTVFDAVGKTLVSGENAEKLNDFDGNWHGWIDFARTLRGVKEPRTGGTRTRDLTDEGYGKVQESMEKATPAQLITLAGDMASVVDIKKPTTTVNGKIVSLVGIILIKQIRVIAGRLANAKDAEEALVTVGQQVFDLTNKIIGNYEEKHQVAKQQTDAVKNGIQQESLAA